MPTAGVFHSERHADTLVGHLLGALVSPADDFSGLEHALVDGCAVDQLPDRRFQRALVSPDHVLGTDLNRIETQLFGRHVDELLFGPQYLRYAETAQGSSGRGVGMRDVTVDVDIGNWIREDPHIRTDMHDLVAPVRGRARVLNYVVAIARESAILLEAKLGVTELTVSSRPAAEAVGAAQDQMHRTPETHREDRRYHLVGKHLYFRPEPRSDLRGDDPHLVASDLQRIGDAVASRNIHAAVYDAMRLMKDV